MKMKIVFYFIIFAKSWLIYDKLRPNWSLANSTHMSDHGPLDISTSRQSWPSFQFSAPVTYRLQNCKLGHDSRRVCTPPTQLNSPVESRRRRRCVLGL